MKLSKKAIDRILRPIPKLTPKQKFFNSYCIRTNNKGEYVCPNCGGTGRIVCDGEFCDPIEGYKDARRETCKKCSGNGYGNFKKYYDQKFKNFRDKELRERYLWNKRRAVIEFLADSGSYAFPDDILEDFFKHIS